MLLVCCSPSQGPCCNSNTCKFVSARPEVRCKEVSDCAWSSNCDGRSAQCPPPNPKANMTFCNENSQVETRSEKWWGPRNAPVGWTFINRNFPQTFWVPKINYIAFMNEILFKTFYCLWFFQEFLKHHKVSLNSLKQNIPFNNGCYGLTLHNQTIEHRLSRQTINLLRAS